MIRRTRILRTVAVSYIAAILAIGLLTVWFLSGRMVVGGVPSIIILRFLQDDIAREAYFANDRQLLHDRLVEMGVEEDIKMYYRNQFTDEDALDRHIHQIMFDRTGYIGEAYRVTAGGRLIPKGDPDGR